MKRSSPLRRITTGIGALTLMLAALVGTTVLSGSAQASTAKDRCQEQLQSAINKQLSRAPGGTVRDNTITYDGGNVIVTVPYPDSCGVLTTFAKTDCPSNFVCLWKKASFADVRWQFRDEGYWQNLEAYGATPFLSFYNNRGHNFMLKVASTDSPQCYSPYSSSSNLGSSYYRYSEYIYLNQTANNC
ncbi:hypothetical protein [Microbispora triticiradicis]|uniref:Peptidase inhibitor family I36 protein n=2 Tax=Microbispora TaxID=2005 RepID=A0ABY3LRD1_9ACTN|nr:MULTISPECIES: hypothetical protein [Microbispora]TLP66539.1 hypothetical protein FED44_03505 [Microbispora fusca]TYB47432.1 hypothetical protein FXF59_29905 [Microbispora tritici]